MTSLEYILIAFCIVLILSLSMSVYYNYKHAIIIFNVEELIEECLDILDEKYRSIGEILEKPLFFDSLEVRQVISDISDIQQSILKMANNLSSMSVEQIEEVRKDDS
jgi:hypothetical protein